MHKDKADVCLLAETQKQLAASGPPRRNRLPARMFATVFAALLAVALLWGPKPLLAQKSDPNLRELRLPRPFSDRARGAVYAMTNASDGNQIAVYERDSRGYLRFFRYVSTGGLGSGGKAPLEAVDALGSQGGLILSPDTRWLFAVNAGSDEISVFQVEDRELTLTDIVPSGGSFPNSLTFDGEYLYVLNAGGEANIAGFRLDGTGHLTYLPDSQQFLGESGLNPPFFIESPAQIGFSALGDFLLVTVKRSNTIHTFAVGDDGLAREEPVVSLSSGRTPFGFVFDRRGRLIVVEPFGRSPVVGSAGTSAASSYDLSGEGEARPVSVSIENLQTATCWITILKGGLYAYATNNFSDSITGYRVRRDGGLSLLSSDGVSARTGSHPVDVAATPDGRFLYNVNAGSGTISMFAVSIKDGSLTPLGEIGGLPIEDGAVGIAVR